jgi:hypothetical protein
MLEAPSRIRAIRRSPNKCSYFKGLRACWSVYPSTEKPSDHFLGQESPDLRWTGLETPRMSEG